LEKPLRQDEDELVARAVRRNGEAFTTLYERYIDQVYRYVYYRVGNQADAEDITGEVFIRAWKAIDRYKIKGAPFYTWLIKITRNLIIDHYRNQKKHLSLDNMECAADKNTSPEAVAESNLDRHRIGAAIKRLKGEKQKVIRMRFIDGFSYSEIARLLKKSEGAVRVIQCRALNELRGYLTE
jgi:RNA polymerase sigma-70 factor (ECF subfamily)